MLGRLAAPVLLIWLAAAPAWAVQPDEILPDPALEARARALSMQLRCLVCQNQSIDDSAAPLARDLRRIALRRRGAKPVPVPALRPDEEARVAALVRTPDAR